MAGAIKVLVTGATGHVGSSTYLSLIEEPTRYDVWALDRTRAFSGRLPKRNAHLSIPDDRFLESDLADYDAVRAAAEGMDVVVHLGADTGGRIYITSPSTTARHMSGRNWRATPSEY